MTQLGHVLHRSVEDISISLAGPSRLFIGQRRCRCQSPRIKFRHPPHHLRTAVVTGSAAYGALQSASPVFDIEGEVLQAVGSALPESVQLLTSGVSWDERISVQPRRRTSGSAAGGRSARPRRGRLRPPQSPRWRRPLHLREVEPRDIPACLLIDPDHNRSALN